MNAAACMILSAYGYHQLSEISYQLSPAGDFSVEVVGHSGRTK
jgi:hypothetical protein